MTQGGWDAVPLLCRPGTTDETFMPPLLTNQTLLIVLLLHEGELGTLRCSDVSALYMSGTNQTGPVLVK